MVRNILGPHQTRRKTDVRLSPRIREIADQYAVILGVPLNVIVTLGVAHLATTMAPLLIHGGKRRMLVTELEQEFVRICQQVRDVS
jgi:hypothetical protein